MANVFGWETVKDFVDYEKFESFRLPWGNAVGMEGCAYTEFQHSMMDEINYMRNSSVPLTREQLKEYMPVAVKDDVYNFIWNSINEARLINLGEVRKVHPGYLVDTEESVNYERDVTYGLSNVVFFFKYNTALRRFEPVFNMSALNINIPEQYYLRKHADTTNVAYSRKYEDRLKMFEFLRDNKYFEKFEFFPIYVDAFDGVTVSHKQYRTPYGVEPAVTSPTLGVNILNHPEVLEALADWTAQGGKINPNNMYLILAMKDDRSKYYLKRYTEE